MEWIIAFWCRKQHKGRPSRTVVAVASSFEAARLEALRLASSIPHVSRIGIRPASSSQRRYEVVG